MSTLTVELPDSLRKRIEALAEREGYTVSQFLASAAGEKLAVVLTMDYLRSEAAAGRRQDFDQYLAAVPDVPRRTMIVSIELFPLNSIPLVTQYLADDRSQCANRTTTRTRRDADNETNYCAACSLSRLLKQDWPRRIAEWE